MKCFVEVALACVIALFFIQQSYCDQPYNTAGSNNWTCSCSAAYQGNKKHVLQYNCSTSCHCDPVAESHGDWWRCLCAAGGFPKVTVDNNNTGCFSACNCTAGSLPDVHTSRKHVPSRVVIVILLICVVLTTLAFLASAVCYLYRKDKFSIPPPVFSTDKETSCNSATNLISSHRASSGSDANANNSFSVKPIAGCFQGASFLSWSKRRSTHGTIIQFSYSELEYATDNFSNSNLIGVGGSSYVYRGQLKDEKIVAIKRLNSQGAPDASSSFSTEVEMLSRLHHCHVVPLIGYCSELRGKNTEHLLVFEYMPNGNLRDCLDGNLGENMPWDTRVTIAIGAARGLEYLHEAAAPRILHRDVKSSNILLDENWRAKITDLGMAKCLRADGLPSCSSSPARMQGTFGYFAPEYAMVGRVSLMSDVFSFGVVLLELITGRQPIHKLNNKEESLVIWATPRLQDSKRVLLELPDPRLKGNFQEEEMQVMAFLAKECLLLDPDDRPTMSEVVQVLSTVAPDKRRKLPMDLFQMSFAHSMKKGLHMERSHNAFKATNVLEEENPGRPTRNSSQSSLPLDTVDMLSTGSDSKEADVVQVDDVEGLIFLTSKTKSHQIPDDETVDLTEPRFESFCMANVKYP